MKRFILKLWYDVLYQFEQHRKNIPDWYYEGKSFEQLPIHLQRIAIAKDVIEQLKNKIYKAEQGRYIRYLRTNDGHYPLAEGKYWYTPAKSIIENIDTCEVCALGSCLLSTVKFKNHLMIDDISRFNFNVRNLLLSLFSEKQLFLIEKAFESDLAGTFISQDYLENEGLIKSREISAAKRFRDQYDYEQERLIAIMENIIANKGEFKP